MPDAFSGELRTANGGAQARDPLTRPAPAEENAGAVHPLPQGGEGRRGRMGRLRKSQFTIYNLLFTIHYLLFLVLTEDRIPNEFI